MIGLYPNRSSLDKLKLSDVVTRNIQSVVKELSLPTTNQVPLIDSESAGLERRSNQPAVTPANQKLVQIVREFCFATLKSPSRFTGRSQVLLVSCPLAADTYRLSRLKQLKSAYSQLVSVCCVLQHSQLTTAG